MSSIIDYTTPQPQQNPGVSRRFFAVTGSEIVKALQALDYAVSEETVIKITSTGDRLGHLGLLIQDLPAVAPDEDTAEASA